MTAQRRWANRVEVAGPWQTLFAMREAFANGFIPSCRQPRHVVVDVKCRCCGSRSEIICWPIDNHTMAICPDCCDATEEHPDGETGHQFEYQGMGEHLCRYCGIDRNCTNWMPYDD